ncbi:MAG: glycosyltransferase [Rhodospirillaceae bacterium]|nr:glycosyltransferase [Rhodospirillaceae bacterium]MBT6961573.1 glycosyltransferase [Rhodospirillaceae bacterium]
MLYLFVFVLAVMLISDEAMNPTSTKFIFVIGIIGVWRYSWSMTHLMRALYYRGVLFPDLREKADAIGAVKKIPHFYVMVTSYRMAPDVTARAYRALVDEVARYGTPTTIFAAVTDEADEALVEEIFYSLNPPSHIHLHLFQQDGTGKRTALADLLRGISRDMPHQDAVVALMDGDSILLPGTLEKTLSFFLLEPNLGALTVDSRGHMPEGSNMAKEWFDLRFAQRHLLMSSLSVSKRLLVLTGRLSFIRASLTVKPDFIEIVENDRLDHWRYGEFKFLTGDDKSTWFWMLKNGWDMRYLPDVQVRSIEDMPSGGFFTSTTALMQRWFGNMLRNNGRAIARGPKSMGLFFWWCLVDQRLSIWTSLTGPAFALLGAIAISPKFLFSYFAWVLFTRFIQATITGFYRGRGFSPYFPPLLYFTQVVGSLVKVYVSFRLNKQSWTRQKISTGGQRPLLGFWHDLWDNYLQYTAMITLLYVAGLSVNVFALPGDAEFKALFAGEPLKSGFERTVIYPAPGPNSARLQTAIDALTPGETLYLGRGTFLLDAPLILATNGIALKGLDRQATILRADFAADASSDTAAVIRIAPNTSPDWKRCATVGAAVSRHDISVVLEGDVPFGKGDFVSLDVANDDAFLDSLGAETWRQQTPPLRRTISAIRDREDNRVYTARAIGTAFPVGARMCAVDLVRDVEVSDFTLVYGPAEHDPAVYGPDAASPNPQTYENTAPALAVDGIALNHTAFAHVHDINVVNAGRHPLHLDAVYGTTVERVTLKDAWNKGAGGSGYLRVARSYYGTFEEVEVTGLRHIAVQWSSHDNLFSNLSSDTDINFHGGFAHDNRVVESCVSVREGHNWPNVYRTPTDAAWAPPDGDGNTIGRSTCQTQ